MTKRDLQGRRFVLLQGPSSWFFAHLGQALRNHGGQVARIGFCPGDRLFWRGASGRYAPFRGTAEDFPDWLGGFLRDDGTTDLIMLGDGRVHHAAALAMLEEIQLEVRPWIVEHGYLRPNLILIEPDGMGGRSSIPHRRFDKASEGEREGSGKPASFAAYAAMDVAYHLSNVFFGRLRYPHYQPHSGIHPFAEYGGWISKWLNSPTRARQRQKTLDAIDKHDGPLFLYPLQLSQDYQLSRYGTGEPQLETVLHVVRSFLDTAPTEARLIVKVHPLDNTRTDWASHLSFAAPRVLYLDGGNLDDLLGRAAGVVTINSTVGLTALQAGVPTLALGDAIYKTAGLTDQGHLDAFWHAPVLPDRQRVELFCRYLRSEFHVPGTFDGPGAKDGAERLAKWLVDPPPSIASDAA